MRLKKWCKYLAVPEICITHTHTHTHSSVDLPTFYHMLTCACAPDYGFSCMGTREAALLFHARMCVTKRQYYQETKETTITTITTITL